MRAGLFCGIGVLLICASAACAAEGIAKDLARECYVKKSNWVDTMLATRAKLREHGAILRPDDPQGSQVLSAIWRQMEADFGQHWAWFRNISPARSATWWFAEADPRKRLEGPIRAVLAQGAEDCGSLGDQLKELARSPGHADDPRWLELFVRACRWRDASVLVERAWLVELRSGLSRRVQELCRPDASPDDPRWRVLMSDLARIAELPGRRTQLAGLQGSLETLRVVLHTEYRGAEGLAGRMARQIGRWNDAVSAIAGGRQEAMKQWPALRDELREFQRSVLLGSDAIARFLAQPGHRDLDKEWEKQFVSLEADLRHRARFAAFAGQVLRPEALVHESDRDPADIVLRRAAALLEDLKGFPAVRGLAEAEKDLARLRQANAAIDVGQGEARYVLFAHACQVRRRIAFSNPLLSFGELLFTKKHRAIYPHMCDQYYGITARPGGGIYVLSEPFGPNPRLRDVLAESVVRRGRLAGQRLSGGPNRAWQIHYDGMGNLGGEETVGGSFLSPDVSYDGQSILFAYVECTGERRHAHHTDPSRGHWAEGRCYHIFKVNVDGSDLEQLTDGTWNDFDPRWLPSGRIAFVSERRGGYLRCGRVCPTYTLYDMAADGSDIRCLSPHETNEWHPSVTHDGRIAWTRWDYVDRHFSAAHMPWITTIDGRDPRPIHGNYAWKGSRPDMELSLRQIPNSPKFVATAAPHHGQAFGSLVIIDPRVRDDDGGSPLKRLTPDAGFPETADGGTETYGTAWPLSEDYHLCVYDAATKPAYPRAPRSSYSDANYGIYLVDAFGNLELIYRDPTIGCHQPIPLRGRPRPPVITEGSQRLAESRPGEATVALVDVYDSLKPWPEGTKIAALRVWQILPLSVAPAARNNGVQVPGTGSVNTGRAVLGTVPVEADGSAHFVVPAGKEVFFQALDGQGLAVQSMRSGTHFQPGETHVCQGCHEPKHRAPLVLTAQRLAMQRAPSRLQPDVDGTNPFSYPRLVQPVLNKHCTDCHAKKADKAPRLDAEPLLVTGNAYMDLPTTYYASYVSLAPKFGFYEYGRGAGRTHRTTPGEFGARASKLYELLVKGHYDVKLPPEDLHRLAVWLDSCSMFYGVYEKDGGEAQLRGEVVQPTLQ